MDEVKIIVTLVCAGAILLCALVTMGTQARADIEPIPPAVCTDGLCWPALSSLKGEKVSVDKADAYILAQMAWGEARGCGYMEIAVNDPDASPAERVADGEEPHRNERGTELREVSSDMQIAATMWCVCNRCDAWGLNVVEAVCAPGQFCGWSSGNPLDDHLYKLAIDVLTRWELEHAGAENVGRVLPAEYLWFTGDGLHNYFRDDWPDGNVWDWSLPDVYGAAS